MFGFLVQAALNYPAQRSRCFRIQRADRFQLVPQNGGHGFRHAVALKGGFTRQHFVEH